MCDRISHVDNNDWCDGRVKIVYEKKFIKDLHITAQDNHTTQKTTYMAACAGSRVNPL